LQQVELDPFAPLVGRFFRRLRKGGRLRIANHFFVERKIVRLAQFRIRLFDAFIYSG
jgi:hypothetical protein